MSINGIANLWSVMSLVQRLSLLKRAQVASNVVAKHANADWHDLPATVQGALGQIK